MGAKTRLHSASDGSYRSKKVPQAYTFLVLSGQVEASLEEGKYTLLPGDALWLPPDTPWHLAYVQTATFMEVEQDASGWTGHRSPLLVRLADIKRDSRFLQKGSNGRKVCVTEMYPKTERSPKGLLWTPGDVIEVGEGGAEISYVNDGAGQDRHLHRKATEEFLVVEGSMGIRLREDGEIRQIQAGEYPILFEECASVEPGTPHQVLRNTPFVAIVVATDSGGPGDKFVQLEPDGEWICWTQLSPEQRQMAYRWPDSP